MRKEGEAGSHFHDAVRWQSAAIQLWCCLLLTNAHVSTHILSLWWKMLYTTVVTLCSFISWPGYKLRCNAQVTEAASGDLVSDKDMHQTIISHLHLISGAQRIPQTPNILHYLYFLMSLKQKRSHPMLSFHQLSYNLAFKSLNWLYCW